MKNLNKELLGEHQILTKTEMQNVSLGGAIPKKYDCVGNGGQRALYETCSNESVPSGTCLMVDYRVLCVDRMIV